MDCSLIGGLECVLCFWAVGCVLCILCLSLDGKMKFQF